MRIFLYLGLLLLSFQSQALMTDKLMMVRSTLAFPETMSNLQAAIKNQGYVLSRVQRVDVGLTRSGFKTDKYRIVFFGKTNNLKMLAVQHPEMVPYLPLKIAIFSEGDETLLISANPLAFSKMYPDKQLRSMFERWQQDIQKILETVQNIE